MAHGGSTISAMDTIFARSADQMWAVVVYQHFGDGRRLLWSSNHHAWLPSYAYGQGFATTPPSDFDGRPYEDDLAAIPELIDEFIRDGICQHCGLSGAEDHFIAPDVFGDAALHCVQKPNRSVVASFGGDGMHKHWGSLHGCSAVKSEFYTDTYGLEYVHFGEGLVASHVRDWDWCSNCTRSAVHIAKAASSKGVPPAKYVHDREYEVLRSREKNRDTRTR